MATVKLLSDEEAEKIPAVKEVFDEIRELRKTDFINNFWRVLGAADPALLKRTWEGLKAVMLVPGNIDPMTREMIYIAVSAANSCSYCIHSHTAQARAKGMGEDTYAEAAFDHRSGRPDQPSGDGFAGSCRSGIHGLSA